MKLLHNGPWQDGGPDAPVVMSCRVRIARNIAGFAFVNRASDTQRLEVMHLLRQVLLDPEIIPSMSWIDLTRQTLQQRQLLVERHLISKQQAEADRPRGVAISTDESLSIMVNEEDHLRMQLLAPGMRLAEIFHALNAIDDRIESRIDFAFLPRWGYLTACPTNVGTGIRLSVMLHLPALKLTNEIERVRRAAKDLHLAVRGYYGEGSDSAGDFYQISNQVTLGQPEEDLLDELQHRVIPSIIQYENEARRLLLDRNLALLDDRVHRAIGILRGARVLGTEEAMKLLSRVRLGALLDRLENLNINTINTLFLHVQPAHLRNLAGCDLTNDQLRETRATLCRETLAC